MTSLTRFARNYGQHGFGWHRVVEAARKKGPSIYPSLSFGESTEEEPIYPTLPDEDDSEVTYPEQRGEVIEDVCQAVVVGKDELGERGSGYKSTKEIQDFQELRSQCLAEGRLFEDHDFPPNDRSLYFSQRPDRHFEWLRPSEIASNPQLFVEGFSRFDIQQGELGDCWLLAATANLTLHRELFNQIVPDDQSFDEDYAGIFHFRFWQYGKWVDVVIDDRLPTYSGRLVFLHSSNKNEFWSALFEKAYAKLHGSYEALEGGNTCEAMEDFTGGVTEMYEMSEAPPNLFAILSQGYQRSSLMGCSIEADPGVLEAETPQGLIRGHAYSITRVCYVDIETSECMVKTPLLRVRNPWGNKVEWNGSWSDQSSEWGLIPESKMEEIGLNFDADGEFWMSHNDFLKYFSRVEICNLNPDSLDLDETPSDCDKKWETSVYEGKWVRGVTAGGCINNMNTFWQNPQYTLILTDPDEDDDEDLCTVIVALMQKNRRAQRSVGLECLTIGYALYKQNPEDPKPLPMDFFRNNPSVAMCPTFINSRQISCRFKLPPGQYCIIPSTFYSNEEGEFLLRVFTEKMSTVKENDEDIGMGDIDDRIKDELPEMPSELEDPVRQFFLNLAGDDEEVDLSELKEILDYSTHETHAQGFSEDACSIMVAMLDKDGSGKLGFEEFKSLWLDIHKWMAVFNLYDPSGTGSIPASSLRVTLNSSGYTLNNRILNILVQKYGLQDKFLAFDDFIMCAVYLKIIIEKNESLENLERDLENWDSQSDDDE